MRRIGMARALLVLPVFFIACSAVLGIEDAELDPNLSTGGETDAGPDARVETDAGPDARVEADASARPDGDAAADASDAEAEGGSAMTPCEAYCAEMKKQCTGDLEVYPSDAVCLATCETFPVGNPGDTTGNSVHCRLENAKLAEVTGEPDFHCPAAGPGGNGVCGENCEGFCTTMLEICPGQYPSRASCRQDCDSLPDLMTFNDSIQSGNSVQCRLYHVGAATQVAALHCGHAAGAPPCSE